jgi:DNA invertase Pin-like site-specific DNA recombinase
MASLAQMERELIVERTKAGLKATRARGRVGGRKRKLTVEKVIAAKSLLATGLQPKSVAETLGVSVATLYRWLPAGQM